MGEFIFYVLGHLRSVHVIGLENVLCIIAVLVHLKGVVFVLAGTLYREQVLIHCIFIAVSRTHYTARGSRITFLKFIPPLVVRV